MLTINLLGAHVKHLLKRKRLSEILEAWDLCYEPRPQLKGPGEVELVLEALRLRPPKRRHRQPVSDGGGVIRA